jgi:hypothetical protein
VTGESLDGASNIVLWEHVVKEIPKTIDPTQLDAHWKKKAKVKIIILDSMKIK